MTPTGTLTATGTVTATGTTTTTTPLTGTATTTATDTPTAQTTPCAFDETVAGWEFSASSCPQDGVVDDVAEAPPAGLQIQGTLSHLVGAEVDRLGHLLLPIQLPAMSLTVAGFSIYASAITLDRGGLTLGLVTLRLPDGLGGMCAPLYFTDVHIGTDLKPSQGTAHFSRPLTIAFAGATFIIKALHWAPDELRVDDATVSLPDVFGASAAATVRSLSIKGDGSLSGSLSAAAFQVGDLSATADGIVVGGCPRPDHRARPGVPPLRA